MLRDPHRGSSTAACPRVTPKHHLAQEQVQPPAEVCSSWVGAVANWRSWEASQRKEAARQREGGASQGDRDRQQENIVSQSRALLHCEDYHPLTLRAYHQRLVPFPESRTILQSAAPASTAQKEGLLALLGWAGGQGDGSHLWSSTCVKYHVSVCPSLGVSPIPAPHLL